VDNNDTKGVIPPGSPDNIACDRFKVSSDTVVTEVGGEAVLLNLKDGTYYGLRQTGVFIWRMLEEGADAISITEAIVGRYGLAEPEAERDVQAFLASLLGRGLIEQADLAGSG
jgi:hypothetical protein